MSTPLRKATGLALHGATVALTPARAVTSHLRKHYHEKYHGRYRFAPLVFAFDLAVFGIAATLVAINIYLFINVPPPTPTLGLVFSTAPIKSAAPQALEAVVEARGKNSDGPVSLRWSLPAGTEILQAEPPLDSTGQAQLGEVADGERKISRITVRFYAPPGQLRFGFALQNGRQILSGFENRTLTDSALLLEPLFEDGKGSGLALADGRIPFRLSNRSNLRLESITLAGLEPGSIDALEPDKDVIVFGMTGHVSALMRAYPIVELDVNRAEASSGCSVRLLPSTGNQAKLEADMEAPGSVQVYHPGLAHPHVKTFDVPAGRTPITIPLDRPADDAAWYAVASGIRGCTGAVAESQITTPFDVSAAIRYYATSGDQIGIGPLPPQVGEETRYWFQVAIGATSKDLSDIVVRVRLPEGVRLTGRDALPSGGGISETDSEVIWTLPYLATNSDGATARFEIALVPTESMIGRTPLLIESLSAEATEVVSGIKLQESIGGLDTSLPEDDRAAGKGIVE